MFELKLYNLIVGKSSSVPGVICHIEMGYREASDSLTSPLYIIVDHFFLDNEVTYYQDL